ncbi:MAG: DJ-1/PfpI family protein [Rhodospirillales bacterium]|nr:DJ-1/PfpI family protein [Rhodospirillales bacterium]MCB9995461.1 DJ-1/PfpI family protein [Rhodospirillales bacterium]
MKKNLLGVKVALLMANGFSEQDMTTAQKALIEAGANVRIISPENGLVNGWDGSGWGHHFAVDAQLSTALGADYMMLVVPGGQRSIDKLNLTGHTKRFVSSFMTAGKPVVFMDDALHLLILTDNIKGRTVAGPAQMGDVVMQAGGLWDDSGLYVDGNMMTGAVTDENRRDFVSRIMDHFASQMEAEQAA